MHRVVVVGPHGGEVEQTARLVVPQHARQAASPLGGHEPDRRIEPDPAGVLSPAEKGSRGRGASSDGGPGRLGVSLVAQPGAQVGQAQPVEVAHAPPGGVRQQVAHVAEVGALGVLGSSSFGAEVAGEGLEKVALTGQAGAAPPAAAPGTHLLGPRHASTVTHEADEGARDPPGAVRGVSGERDDPVARCPSRPRPDRSTPGGRGIP